MTEATIGCSQEVKELVESVRGKDETFNATLRKLVENYNTERKLTESEVEAKIKEMVVREALE